MNFNSRIFKTNKYYYFSIDFIDISNKNNLNYGGVGFDEDLINNLNNSKINDTGLLTVENNIFLHLVGQKYPELISYDVNFSNFIKKTKNKKIGFLERLNSKLI